MSFIHKYCPECGGEIVLGSDGSIWESFCVCELNRQYEEQQRQREEEDSKDEK